MVVSEHHWLNINSEANWSKIFTASKSGSQLASWYMVYMYM